MILYADNMTIGLFQIPFLGLCPLSITQKISLCPGTHVISVSGWCSNRLRFKMVIISIISFFQTVCMPMSFTVKVLPCQTIAFIVVYNVHIQSAGDWETARYCCLTEQNLAVYQRVWNCDNSQTLKTMKPCWTTVLRVSKLYIIVVHSIQVVLTTVHVTHLLSKGLPQL